MSADVAEQARAIALAELQHARDVEIEGSSAQLMERARLLRDAERKAENERKAANAPLRAGIRANDARWKPAVEGFREAGRLLREKITQFELGRAEQAQALLGPSTSAEELPAIVALAAPRPDGVVITTRWTAEVTDLREYLRWVIEQPDPERWVSPSTASLNAYAREKHAAPPGCRAVEAKGTTIR